MTTKNNHLLNPHHRLLSTPTVRCVLASLLEGFEYAEDLQVSAWEFPTELEALVQTGCSINTLRWLVRRGYAEHTTPANQGEGVMPSSAGDTLAFPGGSRFILTESGAALARAMADVACRVLPQFNGTPSPDPAEAPPLWDCQAGELSYRGQLIKRFRKEASNQRRILDEFERHHWPRELADPLPPKRASSRKQRLQDTIKNLNRGHSQPLLHFYAADAGRVVGWKPLLLELAPGPPMLPPSTPMLPQSTP